MPRIASWIAAAWLLMVSPAFAATAPQSAPSDANAPAPSVARQSAAQPSVQRYAQNKPQRAPSATRKTASQAQGPIKVYLLRGLMNVFSLGMDDLAAKLQGAGIAATVMNHADSDFVASRIVTAYNSGDHGPIVLIGHSLGADAIVEVANTLARYNIPVALLVLFDGTEGHQIPPNVTTAVNYTRHFMIASSPGSRTVISNVDLSTDPAIDHLNIDKSPSLQAQTMNYVLQTTAVAPVSRRQ